MFRKSLIALAALALVGGSASATEWDPMFVQLDAIFMRATVKCDQNFMDSETGLHVHDLALACTILGKEKYADVLRSAMKGFDKGVKKNGKRRSARPSPTCKSV